MFVPSATVSVMANGLVSVSELLSTELSQFHFPVSLNSR